MRLEMLDLIDELLGKRLFPDGDAVSVSADEPVVPVPLQTISSAGLPDGDPAPVFEFDFIPLILATPSSSGEPPR